MSDYNAIVIGAGHNGLTTSLLLQKAGLKVLDLERNGFVGGLASNTSFFPGHINNMGAWMMAFAQNEVLDMLEVEKYGFEKIFFEDFYSVITSPDEPSFTMYYDPQKLLAHVTKDFGEQYAKGLINLLQYFNPFGIAMKQAVMNPPISIGKIIDSVPSIEGKNALRKLFYGSLSDLLEEFLPGDGANPIKAAFCGNAADGFYGGPMTPGSSWCASFHLTSNAGSGAFLIKGGIGNYSEALAKAFKVYGGELKLNSPVKKVIVKDNRAVGVELADGKQITADIVVSNCTARYTFMDLIGEEKLPAQFVDMVKSIKYRNPYIQVYYRMNGLPEYTGRFEYLNEGKLRYMVYIGPGGVQGYEDGWDACKHGRIPDRQAIVSEIPTMYDPSLAPEGEHCWVGLHPIEWTPS